MQSLYRVVLLLVFWVAGVGDVRSQEPANLPSSFHDDAHDVTYFFPKHFAPVLSDQGADADSLDSNCAHKLLTARSAIPAGLSTFVVSRISGDCLGVVRDATSLGAFTRTELIGQLIRVGTARITHGPSRYIIDGRPAAITLAQVTLPPIEHQAASIVYAAKACTPRIPLPLGHRKSNFRDPGIVMLCFDFTTRNPDLVNLMLSFVAQFGDDLPVPLFPGNALPSQQPDCRERRCVLKKTRRPERTVIRSLL
jgi:hypothetical protein